MPGVTSFLWEGGTCLVFNPLREKPLQNLHVPLAMRPLLRKICMPLYVYPTKNWCCMYMVVRPLEFAFTARIISFVPRAISKLCPPSENFPTPCAKFKMNCLRTLPQRAGLHGIVPLPTFCSQNPNSVGRALLSGWEPHI